LGEHRKPLFTTDSAAVLRAIEIEADVMFNKGDPCCDKVIIYFSIQEK